MEETPEKTEVMRALSPEARDKLSDITARVRLTRESIDRIAKPQEKKPSIVRRVLVSLVALPILFTLFIVAGYMAIWFILNPLNITQMSGISIFLIGCYAVFLNPKHGSKPNR